MLQVSVVEGTRRLRRLLNPRADGNNDQSSIGPDVAVRLEALPGRMSARSFQFGMAPT